MAKINYDKGIHRHWIQVAREEKLGNHDEVIRQIKENFSRGSITEVNLIDWGK